MPGRGEGVFMIGRHEAVTRSYPIPGQTWPSELCWLFDNIGGANRVHVEVGVYCGRSLFASVGGMERSTAYGVDVEKTSFPNQEMPSDDWVNAVRMATVNAIRSCSDTAIQLNLSGSLSAARSIRTLHPEGLDSVFIDGSHEYADVVADIQEWKPLLKCGGLLCGHDYSTAHIGVMDAVNELCPGFQVAQGTRIWFVRVN